MSEDCPADKGIKTVRIALCRANTGLKTALLIKGLRR